MKENNLIELENNQQFLIIDKLHLDNEVYLFVSEIKTMNKKQKAKFLLEKKLDDEYYLAEVIDNEILSKLIRIVRNFKWLLDYKNVEC